MRPLRPVPPSSDGGHDGEQPDEGELDVVTLFAIIVFAASWYFYARTETTEPVVRLFFGTMMIMAAAVGVLGWLLRAVT